MTIDWIIALVLYGLALGWGRMLIRRWSDLPRWRAWLYLLLSSVVVVAALSWTSVAVTGQSVGQTVVGRTLLGVLVLVWSFVGLLALIRAALNVPWTPFAVARTVLSEAMASRLVPGVVVLLFVGIVALPLVMNTERPLQYRLQQYLSFAFGWTGVVLSVMALAMSCWTLSREMEQKLVFTTLVKPVSRGAFLLGKWIGLVLLNLLLVSIAGITVWAMTVFYLAEQKPIDAYDAIAVRERVLTARVEAPPSPPDEIYEQIEQELIAAQDAQGVDYIISRGGVEQFRRELEQEKLAGWRSIAPAGRSGSAQTYVFKNLGPVRAFARTSEQAAIEARLAELLAENTGANEQVLRTRAARQVAEEGFPGQFVQVDYKLRTSESVPDNKTRVTWYANGRIVSSYQGDETPVNIRQTRQVPYYLIDGETGELALTVLNRNPTVSISFPGKDGLMLLHKVDTFGPNLLRGWLIVAVKLMFISALGLALSSYLQFPIAVLASLLVLGAATSADFILEAANYYGSAHLNASNLIENLIRMVALSFTWPLKMYAAFTPGADVVDGLHISWAQVGRCVFWIGGVWCAVVGLYGWWQFSRRELARVQV